MAFNQTAERKDTLKQTTEDDYCASETSSAAMARQQEQLLRIA